jgi:hypothetical protein
MTRDFSPLIERVLAGVHMMKCRKNKIVRIFDHK